MKPWLSLLCALGVLVSGCTLLPSRPGAVVDGLIVTLRVDYAARIARVLQGEPVRLALEVVARNRARTIVLTRRPAYDFVVTARGGMEIWRWSHGKTIEEIHKDMEVWEWQSSFDPRVTWDQRDLDGVPVPPGTYWAQGMLYTDIGILKSQKVEVRIRQGSPLKLELEIPSQSPLSPRREGYWKLGQPIPLTLKLRNVTERSVELTLLGRPAYDVIVTTDYGRKEVWRWSHGHTVQEIAEIRRLAPWEALEFSVEWDQRDSAGNLVVPGRYCVQGLVRVDLEVAEQPISCLSIGRGLPVELRVEVPERAKRGESVPLVWKITNVSDCPVTLIGLWLDFSVTTPDGAVVLSSITRKWWRFPPVPVKPAIERIVTLQPKETRTFESAWDQLDNEDYLVKPGVYLVQGFLWATQETDASDFVQSMSQRLVIEP